MFQEQELKKMYQILKAYDEGLLINPAENWENDYYDTPLADKKGLKPILRKIEALLPKKDAEESKKAILRRRYNSFNNQIDETVYKQIEKAFNDRKTIEIGYFDMTSAEVTPREIDVYYKNGKYVVAYCHLRKAIRKFRTSRIVSAKLTRQGYSVPHDFDKRRYL